MYREIRAWLALALIAIFTAQTSAAAQEYLPPNVNVIETPFSYVERVSDMARSEQYLAMVGESSSTICRGPGFPLCPTLHFYVRQNDTWELEQSVEFTEVGLAWVDFVDQDKLVLSRTNELEGSDPNYETVEYWLDPVSDIWEASTVRTAAKRPDEIAYHEGVYLHFWGDGVELSENVGGSWQVTDVLYLSTVRGIVDDHTVQRVLVRNGVAYIVFCENGNCSDTRGIALLDITTRTFIDYFKIQTPGLLGIAVFGNQVIVSSHDTSIPPFYQEPQIYENIGGAWQYVGNALPSFEWKSKDNRVAQTDALFFETRTARLDFEDADALTYFERNVSGDWEQIGSVMIPNGDRIMNSMTLLMVYGSSVYFRDSPSGYGLRIFEVTDYFAYLDRDKDIMPQWWEERYGFSPDAFDDFLGDTDQDGLTDTREYGLQTSPIDSDTDGDQMRDDWELQYFFNPRDPSDGDQDFDLDGISNRQEYLNGTNPMIADNPGGSSPPTSSGGGGGSTGVLWLGLLLLLLSSRNFTRNLLRFSR